MKVRYLKQPRTAESCKAEMEKMSVTMCKEELIINISLSLLMLSPMSSRIYILAISVAKNQNARVLVHPAVFTVGNMKRSWSSWTIE